MHSPWEHSECFCQCLALVPGSASLRVPVPLIIAHVYGLFCSCLCFGFVVPQLGRYWGWDTESLPFSPKPPLIVQMWIQVSCFAWKRNHSDESGSFIFHALPWSGGHTRWSFFRHSLNSFSLSERFVSRPLPPWSCLQLQYMLNNRGGKSTSCSNQQLLK